METYTRLKVEVRKSVAYVALNRPEIHNAFDDVLISEMDKVLSEIALNANIRVLVLSGQGKSFCAGADLNWMRRMKGYSYQENFEDAYCLSKMLRKLYAMPIPTVARVHGATIGGGVGLVAACDISIAEEEAVFSLSEVRIGLVPACISPYLLNRIPSGHLRGYFLTGARFLAPTAKEIGLVNEVVTADALDSAVENVVKKILECGPKALQMAKELLDRVPQMAIAEWMEYTARMIAEMRTSDEGQEGLTAFLEKRDPLWKKNSK